MRFEHPDLQPLIKRTASLHARRKLDNSQAKRLSLDELVKHRADAGDPGTFDSKIGLFPITVNHEIVLATQVFVFPK